jgi:hypothetical protein
LAESRNWGCTITCIESGHGREPSKRKEWAKDEGWRNKEEREGRQKDVTFLVVGQLKGEELGDEEYRKYKVGEIAGEAGERKKKWERKENSWEYNRKVGEEGHGKARERRKGRERSLKRV